MEVYIKLNDLRPAESALKAANESVCDSLQLVQVSGCCEVTGPFGRQTVKGLMKARDFFPVVSVHHGMAHSRRVRVS